MKITPCWEDCYLEYLSYWKGRNRALWYNFSRRALWILICECIKGIPCIYPLLCWFWWWKRWLYSRDKFRLWNIWILLSFYHTVQSISISKLLQHHLSIHKIRFLNFQDIFFGLLSLFLFICKNGRFFINIPFLPLRIRNSS